MHLLFILVKLFIKKVIGVFGSLGLIGRNGNIESKSIIDFFNKGEIAPLIISFIYLVHLTYAIPIFPYISL